MKLWILHYTFVWTCSLPLTYLTIEKCSALCCFNAYRYISYRIFFFIPCDIIPLYLIIISYQNLVIFQSTTGTTWPYLTGKCSSYALFRTSVADPHHVGADPDPFFTLMRIRIRFFTLIRTRVRLSTLLRIRVRILFLIEVMFVNLRSLVLRDLHGFILSLYASIVSVYVSFSTALWFWLWFRILLLTLRRFRIQLFTLMYIRILIIVLEHMVKKEYRNVFWLNLRTIFRQ